MVQERILVLGFRRELLRIIEDRGIPYVLWTEKRYKLKGCKPIDCIVSDFFDDSFKIQAILNDREIERISHVIASTESSVVCAYFARRLLKTRVNSKALVERCTDKLIMKKFLHEVGIPMTEFTAVKKNLDLKKVSKELDLPLVVKDRVNSGGRGTVISSNLEVIEKNLKEDRLIEKFVEAPEASVETFIHNRKILFTNVTEYFRKSGVNIIPASFAEAELKSILELNEKVIEAMNIKWGVTHLEIYRSKKGPLFGEIALRPPGGYIMDLISMSYGFNAWEAFLDIETGIEPELNPEILSHSGVVIIHPGEGILEDIKGWDKVALNRCVVETQLSVEVGGKIKNRDGVSAEIGHVLLTSSEYKDIVDAVNYIDKTVEFTVAAN